MTSQSIPPTAREELLAAMQARPDDFWPRGTGHVVLGLPGSREDEKAYHEPGGSFSPCFGSFGVSIWVWDENDQIIATSDTIPLEEIEQRFWWSPEDHMPTLEMETPFYYIHSGINWNEIDELFIKLLVVQAKAPSRIIIAIRSVGPSGGPLYSLRHQRRHLYVNERWQLDIGTDTKVLLTHEDEDDWKTSRHDRSEIHDPKGWACARIEVPLSNTNWALGISDYVPQTLTFRNYKSNTSPVNPLFSAIEITLPDPCFAECLHAQVAHLMMGIVRDETRPGDPINYPVNWQRDGAYIITALARAGQSEVAKVLCKPYAERDFFGGFGSEADAPGLALWAMEELLSCLPHDAQSTFMKENWPHVYRKSELIIEMLETKRPMRVPPFGPIVPEHSNKPDLDFVCEPSVDGLINGRMDWHRPLLYINAIAHCGLLGAATWAERIEQSTLAARWREYAAKIQVAWGTTLDNPRSYAVAARLRV